MSELKVYFIPIKKNMIGITTVKQSYYLKSEADKVIADLEESHKMEVEQLLIVNREQANASNRLRDSMEQAIRHSKYKRCLAMAWWCSAELGMLVSTWESKIKYYKRWQKRWLKIAEKFK